MIREEYKQKFNLSDAEFAAMVNVYIDLSANGLMCMDFYNFVKWLASEREKAENSKKIDKLGLIIA